MAKRLDLVGEGEKPTHAQRHGLASLEQPALDPGPSLEREVTGLLFESKSLGIAVVVDGND